MTLKKAFSSILSLAVLGMTVPVAVPAQCFAEDGRNAIRACRVKVEKRDGRWLLLVDEEPFIVKGVEYSPDPACRAQGECNAWMLQDENDNGLCDAAYDSFIDANRDDYQDADENAVGDFQLLEDMGCNTIRIYHHDGVQRELLRDLFLTHGIRSVMGDYLGAYTVGSGADWNTGTDYTDPAQREKMKESVRAMVMEHKDEPYVLMWMLGNENDSAGSQANSTSNNTNAARQPEAYARFLNEVCQMIKRLDPNHPVGVCNATTRLLTYYKRFAPAIDIIGYNAYTGPYGFGPLWTRTSGSFDRPVLITEYGTDSFNQKKGVEDEHYQSEYHRRAWRDIEANSYWGGRAGNAVGGVVYSWLDKWWLCGSAKEHDTALGAWQGNTIDGWFNDEWLGICGQGKGIRAPFLRQPKKAYFLYRDELWNRSFRMIEQDDFDVEAATGTAN